MTWDTHDDLGGTIDEETNVNDAAYEITRSAISRISLALAVLDAIGDDAAEAIREGRAAVVPVEATEAMRDAYMRASITYANPEWTCADIIAAGRLDRGGAS